MRSVSVEKVFALVSVCKVKLGPVNMYLKEEIKYLDTLSSGFDLYFTLSHHHKSTASKLVCMTFTTPGNIMFTVNQINCILLYNRGGGAITG